MEPIGGTLSEGECISIVSVGSKLCSVVVRRGVDIRSSSGGVCRRGILCTSGEICRSGCFLTVVCMVSAWKKLLLRIFNYSCRYFVTREFAVPGP